MPRDQKWLPRILGKERSLADQGTGSQDDDALIQIATTGFGEHLPDMHEQNPSEFIVCLPFPIAFKPSGSLLVVQCSSWLQDLIESRKLLHQIYNVE